MAVSDTGGIMKIILLTGKRNCGKTTTLDLLYKRITQNGTKNIIEKRKEFGYQEKDFKCVVSYADKEVAIYSMGDYINACVDAIIEYANRDILILAYSNIFQRHLDKVIGKFNYHCVIEKKDTDDNVCKRIMEELEKKLPNDV